jgi:hypothetical protein
LEREAERMVKCGWADAGWGLQERNLVLDEDAGTAFRGKGGSKVLGLEKEMIGDVVANAVQEWIHTEKGDCGCS